MRLDPQGRHRPGPAAEGGEGQGEWGGLSQRERRAEGSQERGLETLWWAGRSEGGF